MRQQDVGPDVVAKIGNYVVTKKELEQKLLTELRPSEDKFGTQSGQVDAETVLLKMIAEKAMVIEARKQNYLDDPLIHSSIKRYTERRLIMLWARKQLEGKTTATDEEIDEKLKTNPKLDRARAKAMLTRATSRA